jgi:uracil-DNA glycosylase
MTRRKRSYRSIVSLQRDNAVCRACAEEGFPLESLPVFEGEPGQRAMIVGQAPGIVEGQERRPWRGRAGQTLRRWLGMGEEEFYATFYCVSVTRCYPGRHPSGRGDRAPTPREIELCRFWLDWEVRLLRPALIVPVGGLGLRGVLRRTNLTECVGCRFELDGATVLPLPHPSGASGWLNEPANRDRLALALELLRGALDGVRAEARAGRTRTR